MVLQRAWRTQTGSHLYMHMLTVALLRISLLSVLLGGADIRRPATPQTALSLPAALATAAATTRDSGDGPTPKGKN